MTASATGENSAGAVFSSTVLKGATLTATGSRYGLFDGATTTISNVFEQTDFNPGKSYYQADISGTSIDGTGVFIKDYTSIWGGKISGQTTTGNGVESGTFQMTKSEVDELDIHYPELNGTTTLGFGILARSVWDGQTEMGNIDLDSGKINGYSEDGTGVAGNIGSNTYNDTELEIVGNAEKGQGIVSKSVNASYANYNDTTPKKLILRGESNGASTTTMSIIKKLLADWEGNQPTYFIPTSAGILSAGAISIYDEGFDTDFVAIAPTNLKQSYGLYNPENENEATGVTIRGIKKVNVFATGDIGMKTGELHIDRSNRDIPEPPSFSVNVDSVSKGIEAKNINFNAEESYESVDLTATLDVKSSDGNGITAPNGLTLNSLLVNISAINVGIHLPDPDPNNEGGNSNGVMVTNCHFTISGGRYGFKANKQSNYNFTNTSFEITTTEEGMTLDEENSNGSIYFTNALMNIESGTYGLKFNEFSSIYYNFTGKVGNIGIDYQNQVTAEDYPIWINNSINIDFYPGYNPEDGENLDDKLSFIATSKNLIPDSADYPAFYVTDHNISSYSPNVQIIENYETPVSKPFNNKLSTPYSIAGPFNIANYGNYVWTANRTDNDAEINVIQHKISENEYANELSTDDQTYDEARLTATRRIFNENEKIFNEPGVSEDSEILHQINMLVRREEQYRVTYDGNGADGGDVPIDNNLYSENVPVNVAPQGNLTLTDHTFVGWLNSADDQIYQNPQIPNSPTSYTMGQSDVTFTAQWRSNSVVEELTLIDGKIPSNLNFGTHDIQYDTDKIFYATDDGTNTENSSATNLTTGEVGILDTRLNTEGWSLTVKQLDQFKTSTNQELSSAELGFKVSSLDTSQSTGGIPSGVDDEEIILIPGNARELLRASNGQGKGTVTLPIERFTLKVPKGSSKQAGQSTTEVEWTLSNVPAP